MTSIDMPLEQEEAASCGMTVLQTFGPLLTKQHSATGTSKGNYAKTFRIIPVPVADIHSLAAALQVLERNPRVCVIRGEYVGTTPERDVRKLQRNGGGFVPLPRRWVMLDIDGIEAPEGMDPTGLEAIDHVIGLLPAEFRGVSHFYQWSSSAGLKGRAIKLHLWFWLDRPVHDEDLERWAEGIGIVDPAVFRTVQVHYTAAPIFLDGRADPLEGRRSGLRLGDRDTVPLVLLRRENTPALQVGTSSLQRGGILPAPDLNAIGKAIDRRERLLVSLRWQALHAGITDEAEFVETVWQWFQQAAELTPTEKSSTAWTRDAVEEKCRRDFKRFGEFAKPLPPPPQYLDPIQAQDLVRATIRRFLTERKSIGIRAAAGLGKTSDTIRELVALPDLHSLNVAIYTPTKALATEWATSLNRALLQARRLVNVWTVFGRDGENCHKIDLVSAVGRTGGGVQKRMCFDQKSGEKCQFWGTCGYSRQNGDGPGIRIYAHAKLGRGAGFKDPEKPDLVIVDEAFLAEMHDDRAEPLERLSSHRGFTSDPVNPDFTVNDLADLIQAGRTITDLIVSGQPLLTALRSKGFTRESLERLGKIVGAFTPSIDFTPALPDPRKRAKIERYPGLQGLYWLGRFYRLLAEEIDVPRDDARCIAVRNGMVHTLWRRELKRLDGVPVLLLDADLETELARLAVPDIEIVDVPVRYNANVVQVCDHAFGKGALLGGDFASETGAERASVLQQQVREFIEAQPDPAKVLVVTYIDFRCILTGEKDPSGVPFGTMACGARVGHFGNIRGFDGHKDCDTVIIVGRNEPPAYVPRAVASALWHDDPRELTGDMIGAVRRAITTAETNQAVARLRLVWAPAPKRVYLLSSEPVPFPVDRQMRWEDLRQGGTIEDRLLERFGGVLPLSPGVLHAKAPDLFPSRRAAEAYLERAYPAAENTPALQIGTSLLQRGGILPGRCKVEGKGGKPSRFLFRRDLLDVQGTLANVVGELVAYTGPGRGVVMRERLFRPVPWERLPLDWRMLGLQKPPALPPA